MTEDKRDRDNKGRFVKGSSGNPNGGRRSRTAQELLDAINQAVTVADWQAIVEKAVKQARGGNPVARKWLSDYLVGVPVQKLEHSGPNGQPIYMKWLDGPDNLLTDPTPSSEASAG